MSHTEKELTYKSFLNREYEFKHSPFEKEFEFYEYVKSGDKEGVERTMTALGGNGAGQLSDDKLRNLKYHFIVTIALITRFCVEGGMGMEKAYTLSDLYINRMDKCMREEDIHNLHRKAVFEFTGHMNRLGYDNIYSKPVVMAMDYIYDNLHSKISENEIAEYVSLSPSYLSRIFNREVGVSIAAYIAIKRVETAQNMLKYSNYTPIEISNYLAFSSNSYFINVFKKYTGMTPNEYRKKYFREGLSKIRANKQYNEQNSDMK